MNHARRIAHSSAAFLLSNFANKITGFLIMLTVARVLGAERFGVYTAVFAYVSIFALLTDLGLTTIVTRKLSQDDQEGRRWLGTALILRWPVSILVYVSAVAGALLLYGWDERASLIAISSVSLLIVPLTTYSSIFLARVLPQKPAIINLFSRFALLIAVQLFARNGGSVAALITLEVIIGATANIATWWLSRRTLTPLFALDFQRLGELLREGIPLFLMSAFVMLYCQIDVFFLEFYGNASAVGIYAAACRLTDSMPVLASALTASIFPVLCQQVHSFNEASLTKLVRISLKILLGAIVPLALVLAFHGDVVVKLLYGNRFDGAATLLAILACNQALVFTNILMSTLLVARGKGSSLMFLTAFMLALNVLLNFLVIPRYGVIGAAWVVVVTDLAGTIGCLALTSMATLFLQVVSRLVIPALICIILLISFAPTNVDQTFTSLWPVLLVFLVYPVFIGLLRVFDREEWERLRALA